MSQKEKIKLYDYLILSFFESFKSRYKLFFGVVALSIIFGMFFSYNTDKKSSITYRINLDVSLIIEDKFIHKNLQEKFFSEDTYKLWKKDNVNSQLEYSDFSNIIRKNGYVYSREGSGIIFEFSNTKKDTASGKINILNHNEFKTTDYFKYFKFVSSLVSYEIQKKANELINSTNKTYDKAVLKLGITVPDIRDKLIIINYPEYPKLKRNLNRVLIIYSIIGVILATFLLLLLYLRDAKQGLIKNQ